MLLWLSVTLASSVTVNFVHAGCAIKEFMPCVVQLTSQKVPFDTNVMNVISNITTEAKLLHSCRTYERVLPCFGQRISSCGTKPQKALFDKGKRLHSYLCAPFSVQRQKIFLRQQTCIRKVTKSNTDGKCIKPDGLLKKKLQSCRSRCGENPFCNTKTDISEISACTFLKIENECGSEAAQFFSQMQQVLTNLEYPVQCSYNLVESTTMVPPRFAKTGETRAVKPFKNLEYSSTAFITVYPTEKHVPSSSVRHSEPKSRVRSGNYYNLFAPAKTLTTTEVSTTSTFSSTTVKATKLSQPILYGARPIPDAAYSSYASPDIQSQLTAKLSEANETHSTSKEKTAAVSPKTMWMPSQKLVSKVGPSNPMVSPFHDTSSKPSNQVLHTINTSSQPPQFNFVFANEPTPEPFKININWMDDPQRQSPWYQQTLPQTFPEATSTANPFSVVEPIIKQLKSKPLNFTEMGNTASNYFSAAMNAFSSGSEYTDSTTEQHNPWRSLIDAVAPTIQAVSPEFIPRIRQEMERLDTN